ncbi:MAG TPA: hypothetical protein VG269_02130 [Tepidisphaeraceae bacterium]|nr:hypothetical protein [Tepidisphaeraceae bacterium]
MLACILVLFVTLSAAAQTRPAVPLVTLSCDRQLGPLAIDHIALGQGGLSADPMFHSRVAEIRALHPGLIRLFVQAYYDLLPERGRLHFETLDRSVDDIINAGSSPLMCLCFKFRSDYAGSGNNGELPGFEPVTVRVPRAVAAAGANGDFQSAADRISGSRTRSKGLPLGEPLALSGRRTAATEHRPPADEAQQGHYGMGCTGQGDRSRWRISRA